MGKKHLDTPKKSKILGAMAWARANNQPVVKRRIFRALGISHAAGYSGPSESAVLPDIGPTYNNTYLETRGRKPILSDNDVELMINLVETGGFDAASMGWAALPAAAGVDKDVSTLTVQRAGQRHGYSHHLSVQLDYLDEKTREVRVQGCRELLR